MKSATVTHWWDRGRARWRSRPENKQRSYDEYVGGKHRPHRIPERGARRLVTVALAQYAQHARPEDERDEHDDPFMERLENVATCDARPDDRRWKHSGKRRDCIASKRDRRVGSHGRKHRVLHAYALPPRVLAWCRKASREVLRFELLRALLYAASQRALEAGRARYGFWTADARALFRDPDFVRAVPERRRRSIGWELLRGLREYGQEYGDPGVERMLEALCVDNGRYAQSYAAEWVKRIRARDERSYYWAGDATRSPPLVDRVRAIFERNGALGERFYAWMGRHTRAA